MERMEDEKKAELRSFLKVLPPVEFCCVYGSTLHLDNKDKAAMVDYIVGVSDPLQWHSENLKLNRNHYASWMIQVSGAKLITDIADKIGVGVHFNPFVTWNDKMIKYGVVRMHDLIQDVLNWDRFYLSGRLQKPVHMLLDSLDIENVNSANLRAAVSAALLLLPPNFSEEDLYAKICSLSYMGDLRMLFAEDKNKVKKIVQGQFNLFQSMYEPFLEEYGTTDLIRFSSSGSHKTDMSQIMYLAYAATCISYPVEMVTSTTILKDFSLSTTQLLVSSLPRAARDRMGMKLGVKKRFDESGRVLCDIMINSREEAAKCMQKVLQRTVMISSTRQAVSGLLTAGGLNAARYLGRKMAKAWKSWT